jgi:hypothetical protein
MQRCWARKPSDRPTFDAIIAEFLAGRVFLRGTDREDLRCYCEATQETDEAHELGLTPVTGDKRDTPITPVETLVERFAESGVPDHLKRRFCARLRTGGAPPKVIAQGLSLLLDSELGLEALSLFHALPRGVELTVFLADSIRKLPTDDPAFNRELVLTACWHGAADLCVLYVDEPDLREFALEMVAHEGVDSGLKTAVADRCVQLFITGNDWMLCAALRCLVAIGEIKRIPVDAMMRKIQTEVPELRNCIVVIAAQLLSTGVKMSAQFLEALVEFAREEDIAVPALVLACRDRDFARLVLRRIGDLTPQTQLRVVLAAMAHSELFVEIRGLLDSLVVDDSALLEGLRTRLCDRPSTVPDEDERVRSSQNEK